MSAYAVEDVGGLCGPDAELLERFRTLVYREYGIHYQDAKVDVLRMKLRKLVSLYHIDLEELYEKLIVHDLAATKTFLHEVAVGHTFFFREEAHFARMTEDVSRRALSKPLVWCAASSTGEEPYSIVISLLEQGLRSFKVLASDLNHRSLEAMHRGVYNLTQFQNVPERILRSYFTRVDEHRVRVRPVLRQYLSIKCLNLHTPLAFETQFDYIFCRNVMIYFDDQGRTRVLNTLVDNLALQGLLFVGHSEALLQAVNKIEKAGPAYYRKVKK